MTKEQLAGKAALRKHLASLSFSEKIKILEKLRDRSLSLGAQRIQDKLEPEQSWRLAKG